MNFLSMVKTSNYYDFAVSNLYKEDEPAKPITDIEGATALLLTDGTSWQLVDGAWQQIEQDLDYRINTSFYSFVDSICNSIHNHFVNVILSTSYKEAILVLDDTNVNITNLADDETVYVKKDDFVILGTKVNRYLTKVTDLITEDDETIGFKVDNTGVNIRITGEKEVVDACFVSFPMGFLEAVARLLAFDLFERDDKEKKVERLGNYSVTNFDTNVFYGEDNYPKNIMDKIKYWQRIFI